MSYKCEISELIQDKTLNVDMHHYRFYSNSIKIISCVSLAIYLNILQDIMDSVPCQYLGVPNTEGDGRIPTHSIHCGHVSLLHGDLSVRGGHQQIHLEWVKQK